MNFSGTLEKEKGMHRLHGIDFCRAVFMILGLFYHTALIYNDGYVWRVSSADSSVVFNYISNFIHAFRMEAFYIISGFFYFLVFTKKNNNFLNERLLRIVPPLILCGFLINPIMNYFSDQRTYNWGELTYFTDGQWLGHLWFLGNLIAYFILTYPICSFILNTNELSKNKMLICFYFLIPFLSLCSLAFSKVMLLDNFVFITFDSLFYYYFYFLFGCVCYKNRDVFVSILNYKIAFYSAFIYLFIYLIINYSYFKFLEPDYIKAITKLSNGFLVLTLIAITYKLGVNGSKLTRKFSDSSYTIYLLHQPLIVLIYYFFFESLHLPLLLEYVLIISLTFLISFSIHHWFLVKNPTLLFLFNGVSKKRL